MKTELYNQPNFKATRILSTTTKRNNLDVFKLSPKDIKDRTFARKCYNELDDRKSHLSANRKKMKLFFKDFLNRSIQDYFIVIKNCEEIAGLFNSFPHIPSQENILNNVVVYNYTDMLKNTILYGALRASDNMYCKGLTGVGLQMLHPNKNQNINLTESVSIRKSIKEENSDIEFDTNTVPNIDLNEYLGIKEVLY